MKHALLVLAPLALLACSSGPASSATTDDAGDNTVITPGTSSNDVGSGSDSGATDPGIGGSSGGGSGSGGSTSSGSSGGSSSGSGGAGDDGGGTPTSDGGAPGGGTGVFADAGAYAATLGPSARNPKHTGDPNPAGTACLSCHGGQRPNVKPFLFAGTVWSDSSGKTPTPMAEVRIVQANGTATSVYSDGDGNYYFEVPPNTPLSAPAMGGARDAKAEMNMTNVFNDGDCNSCHRIGGQGPIALP